MRTGGFEVRSEFGSEKAVSEVFLLSEIVTTTDCACGCSVSVTKLPSTALALAFAPVASPVSVMGRVGRWPGDERGDRRHAEDAQGDSRASVREPVATPTCNFPECNTA